MANIVDTPGSSTAFFLPDDNTDSYFGLDFDDTFGLGLRGAGLIDGGSGHDTVIASDLGTHVFVRVERLGSSDVTGSVSQLNSFTDFGSSGGAPVNTLFVLRVTGTGTLDLRDDMGNFGADLDAGAVGAGFVFYGDRNNDRFGGSGHGDKAVGGGGNDILHGYDGDDELYGGDGDDTIFGSPDGVGGNDRIEGGADNDFIWVFANGGTVNGGTGTDTVRSNNLGSVTFSLVEVLEIQFGDSVRSLTGQLAQLRAFSSITQTRDGEPFGDSISFVLVGQGSSAPFEFGPKVAGRAVTVDARALTSGAKLVATAFDDELTGTAFNDTLEGGNGWNRLHGGGGNDTLRGGSDEDNLFGEDGRDSLFAGGGGDSLSGGADDDILDGGTGIDFMWGGVGNDTYHVDDPNDYVSDEGAGTDLVFASVSFTLPFGSSIENLTLLEVGGAIDGTGNEQRNVITGNGSFNILDGLAGADTLRGLGGGDVYVVDNAGDKVYEAIDGGFDEVWTSVSYALLAGQEIEHLSTTNQLATSPLVLSGNEFNQKMVGNAGANRLDGKGGADTLQGLGGNDVYVVDDLFDHVVEAPGGGTDTVYVAMAGTPWRAYDLEAGQEIEYLRAASGSVGLQLGGNEFANNIFGGAGRDTLTGGGGADKLTGNGGVDTFAYRAPEESGSTASDTIHGFVRGEDRIGLYFDGDTVASGFQGLLFAGQSNRVIANSVTWVENGSNTIVQADVNGDAVADFRVVISGTGLQLDAGDFFLGIPT